MSRFGGGFHMGNQSQLNPLMGGLGSFGLESPSQSDRTYDTFYNQRSGGDSRRGGDRGGQGFDQRNYGNRRSDSRERDRGDDNGRMLPIGSLKNRAGLLGSPPMEQGVTSTQGYRGGQGNIQQQGLVAALQAQQTQELLAALQAQSTLHSQSMQQIHHGLLPTPANLQHVNRSPGGSQRQFDRQFDRNRQRQSPYQNQRQVNQQPPRKRSSYQDGGSYGQSKKRREDRPQKDNRERRPTTSKSTGSKPVVKGKEKGQSSKAKAVESQSKDDINQELLDAVEQLRTRKKIDRNVVDEDIDKLSLFSFDGQMYRCDLCKILCRQIKTLRQHLMGKRHTLNVIEARQAGNDVNRDIIDIDLRNDNWLEENPGAKTILQKQSLCLLEEKQKLEALEKKCPSNFVHYRIDTRKTAIKQDDVIEITSVSEASVHIKEFTSEKHMFGCEFIKAVSGFSCRLCNIFLQSGKDVNDHIQSKVHSSNYQSFVEKNADYENSQLTRNKDLVNRLGQYEDKDVVLFEVVNEEGSELKHLGKKYIVPDDESLVRVSPMMSDWHEKEDTKEEEKVETEKEESSTEKVEEVTSTQDPVEETESAVVEIQDGYQVGEDMCEGGEVEEVDISEQELVGFEGEEEAEAEEIQEFSKESEEAVQEDINQTEELELEVDGDNALIAITTDEIQETDQADDVEPIEPGDAAESTEPAEVFKSPKVRGRTKPRGRGRGSGRRTAGTRSRAAKTDPEPEATSGEILEEESFEVIDEVGDEGDDDEPMQEE